MNLPLGLVQCNFIFFSFYLFCSFAENQIMSDNEPDLPSDYNPLPEPPARLVKHLSHLYKDMDIETTSTYTRCVRFATLTLMLCACLQCCALSTLPLPARTTRQSMQCSNVTIKKKKKNSSVPGLNSASFEPAV